MRATPGRAGHTAIRAPEARNGKLRRPSVKDLLHWKPYALRLRARFLLGVPDISREFAGKTVALVGNARSLGATRMGEAIDRCDIVVRFNQCPMVGEPSHGRRTDWIAEHVSFSPALFGTGRPRRTVVFFPPAQDARLAGVRAAALRQSP